MKLKLTFLFILIVNYCFVQNIIQGETLTISDENGNSHPQIEVNALGECIVLWTNPVEKSLMLSKSSIGLFSVPIQLNPPGIDVQSFTWSGSDMAIEENKVYVVFKEDGYETGEIYLIKSTDHGNSFSDTVRVSNLSSGFAQYPDIAVFQDTVYVTFMAHDEMGMNPQYVLARSVDGGNNFESAVIAGEIVGDEACDCCQPEIVINEDKLVILFRNNDENIRDIKGVVSLDRGVSFSQIIHPDNHNWLIPACPSTGPDARITQSNLLYTVYKSVDGSAKIYFNTIDLENTSANTSISLSDGINNGANYPQLSVENQLIGVVFEGIANQTDVFLMYSFDGENGFDDLQRINLTNLAGIQNKPDISIHNGTFHIVYAENNFVKYLNLFQELGLMELDYQTNNQILISKQANQNPKIEIGSLIIDLKGTKFNYDENTILKLECGTYFIITDKAIRKLIIIP